MELNKIVISNECVIGIMGEHDISCSAESEIFVSNKIDHLLYLDLNINLVNIKKS